MTPPCGRRPRRRPGGPLPRRVRARPRPTGLDELRDVPTFQPPLPAFGVRFRSQVDLLPGTTFSLRDPVERDPEREDRERGHDPLPELGALQPLCDLVAEPAGAD